MQTLLNLPDVLYRKSEALASLRGSTVEQFIIEAVHREIARSSERENSNAGENEEVELPLIRSKRPGTLDLSDFDFDDLLT